MTHMEGSRGPRGLRLGRVALGIAIALALGFAGWAVGDQASDKEVVTEQYGDTRDDLVDVCKDKDNADKPECATTPPSVTELVGPQGPPGPGPSDGQVQAAVNELLPLFIGPGIADYCGTNGCRGSAGTDGADGADGEPGNDGLTGEQGPAGPPGQDGAEGAQGPPGEDGQDCPDGTSLQETTVMTSPVDSTVIYACR